MYAYQNNQLDETFATHQRTDCKTLAPEHTTATGSPRSPDKFGEEGNGANTDNVSPDDAAVEQTDVGVETGQGEVEGEEQCSDQILNLFGDLDVETSVMWTNHTSHECTEDSVDTDNTSEEGASKTQE